MPDWHKAAARITSHAAAHRFCLRAVHRLASGFCLAAALPLGAHAQLLRGRVLDAGSGEPVVAAEVRVHTSRGAELARVLSDENGVFNVDLQHVDLPAILVLSVYRIGYDSTATASVHVGVGEDFRFDLRIRPRAVNLPPIEVVAERLGRYLSARGFYQRRAMGLGKFMDEAQIDSLHPAWVHDLFWRVAGFRLAYTGRGYEPVSTRGGGWGGTCLPAVWLDGFKQRRGPWFSSLDDLILPEQIGGIEMYSGPAEVPAQYKDHDAVCGAIIVWSRH